MTLNPLPSDKVFFDSLCEYLDWFAWPQSFEEIQYAVNEYYISESPWSDNKSPSYWELMILNTMSEDYCKLRYPELLDSNNK